MSVILIFLDGVGIGGPAPRNPLSSPGLHIFYQSVHASPSLPENGVVIPTDACLGVKGLPQSATGQTALLTGINAPAMLGRHVPGFPTKRLRSILKEHSLFKQMKDYGKSGTFINTFRPLFFNLPMELKYRLSATTIASMAAGQHFYDLDDLRKKRSLYHDFTNRELISRGFDVPVFSPAQAASILHSTSADFDCTLYEYFLTDKAGHKQDVDKAGSIIKSLDTMIHRAVELADLDSTTIIVCSDHGNIEDLSTKTHTRNPALTMVWGAGALYMQEHVRALTDITPTILHILNHGPKG